MISNSRIDRDPRGDRVYGYNKVMASEHNGVRIKGYKDVSILAQLPWGSILGCKCRAGDDSICHVLSGERKYEAS